MLLAVGGLVLAAGALSLAELAMEPGGRDDSAADYVREAPRGPEEPAPDSASGSVSGGGPQDPGPVTSGEGRPVDPSASGSGPAEPPAPGATATASPTGSPDPDRDDQEPGDATALARFDAGRLGQPARRPAGPGGAGGADDRARARAPAAGRTDRGPDAHAHPDTVPDVHPLPVVVHVEPVARS
ncbi:hypothetical protein [Streptomyces sp. CYG20]|uniref:hypothetical protein n=1 Tax=Streptomyces sp. CYG20 TaxID=2838873 RepID=UPI0020373804|nr:hypothetical protein [Streptomyces sp. CYG20]